MIEKWIMDGSLPALKALRERGAYGRIGHSNQRLVELPWVTFYTGMNQGQHGAFHHLQWVSEDMTYKRIDHTWLNMTPFWRQFTSDSDPRTIVIDLPFIPSGMPYKGIEINGYASYETINGIQYTPPEIQERIHKNVGKPLEFFELYELHSVKYLLKLRKILYKQLKSLTSLGEYLLKSESWDLFLIVLPTTHRGGHRFWDLSNLLPGEVPKEKDRLSDTLKEIYKACDKAVAELLKSIPKEANIIVCSLHGMKSNQSRLPVLTEMLERILSPHQGNSRSINYSPKIIKGLRGIIPNKWRYTIKTKLPIRWQDKLTSYWHTRENWANIKAFTLIGDYINGIQINLKDRESKGIVTPGVEYQELLENIKQGLSTFKDSRTGQPIIEKISERHELGLHGNNLMQFPDLTIIWQDSPSSQHEAVVSDDFGRIDWPTPFLNPDGRSGNHRNQGFFIGVGDMFLPNSHIDELQILDLAPTILKLLNQPLMEGMEGKAIIN